MGPRPLLLLSALPSLSSAWVQWHPSSALRCSPRVGTVLPAQIDAALSYNTPGLEFPEACEDPERPPCSVLWQPIGLKRPILSPHWIRLLPVRVGRGGLYGGRVLGLPPGPSRACQGLHALGAGTAALGGGARDCYLLLRVSSTLSTGSRLSYRR